MRLKKNLPPQLLCSYVYFNKPTNVDRQQQRCYKFMGGFLTGKNILVLFMISVLLSFHFSGKAQYDNVWAFGRNAGLDFNSGTPQAIKTSLSTGEGSASICDANGKLLFYTNGSDVWDRNHDLMPNGNNLPGILDIWGSKITLSTTQASTIVPFPGDNNAGEGTASKYFVFSLGHTTGSDTTQLGKLFYSVIDMSLNNGLGDVVAGQKGILLDSLLTEQMTPVAGNDCNVWLLTVSRLDSSFKVFNIDLNGVNPAPIISKTIYSTADKSGSSVTVSPDRSKLASSHLRDLVLYDFDPDYGTVSNPRIINTDMIFMGYRICFSPDNTKLYFSGGGTWNLHQLDLSSNNTATIIASKTLLQNSQVGGIRRGPDGKIYVNRLVQSAVSVINQPNLPGLACQYVPDALPLLSGTESGSITCLADVAIPVVQKIYNHVDTVFCSGWEAGIPIQALDPGAEYRYTWSTGDTTAAIELSEEGTYWVAYGDGCRNHIDSFIIKGYDLFASITVSGFELGTTGGPYTTYQWYFNGEIIPGATSPTYTVTANGEYQLEITNEYGCTFLSAIYPVTNWGDTRVRDLVSLGESIRIYPSPTDDIVYIQSPVSVAVHVVSIDGRIMLKADAAHKISLKNLASGIYLLRIVGKDERLIKVEKVIKY